MQVEVEEKKEIYKSSPEVFVIILKDLSSAHFKVLGEEQYKWLENAVQSYKYLTVDYDGSLDVKQLIKPLLTNAQFTIVLFSNTPLFTSETMEEIVDYITFKDINACKLPSGYAFNTMYLKNANEIMFDSFYMKNEQDFYELEHISDLNFVYETLQKRIFDYLTETGVEIMHPKNTYIERDVIIGKGTKIYGNVVIKGNSRIGKNCVVNEYSKITNSEIANNVHIMNCEIEDSIIFDDCKIMPYCYITSSVIQKNCIIPPHSYLLEDTVQDKL